MKCGTRLEILSFGLFHAFSVCLTLQEQSKSTSLSVYVHVFQERVSLWEPGQ